MKREHVSRRRRPRTNKSTVCTTEDGRGDVCREEEKKTWLHNVTVH
jgi:hypothetical protein